MSFRWTSAARSAGKSRRATANANRGRVVVEVLEDRTLLTTIPLNSSSWTPIGPSGINTGNGQFGGFMGTGGPTAGRIAGVAGDPTNANIDYIAAAGGGVWKTTNGGGSWVPLTDSQSTDFMGSIAVSQSNPNVIYAGTGEANNSGLDTYYGRGVLISTDGGSTWTLSGNNVFNRKSIGAIAIDPTNPNVAYAAVSDFSDNGINGTNTGIWKTSNGGATWVNTTTSISTSDAWTGIEVDRSNPLNLYASVGSAFGSNENGVYKSTDGGQSWQVAGNFPNGIANGRIALAISATNPKEVIASVSSPTTSKLLYLQRSTDGGQTWNNLTAVPDYISGQGFYNNVVAISPTDANVIFAAGIINYSTGTDGIVMSRDGGTTWTDVSVDSNGVEPHTDHHAMGFDADGRLLEGNDGGIWRLDFSSANFQWADLNSNLQITEFQGVSLDPTNANIVYGGSQDNGTEKFNGNTTWTMFNGGDGGPTAVDPSNPQTVYFEYVNLALYRSDDGGATFQQITTGISASDPVNFYAPYTLDPSNPSHLLYGTNHVYTSADKGNSWTVLATPGQNGFNSTGNVQSIAVAPTNSKTIYVTTTGGQIFVSTDAGATWTQRGITGVSDVINKITVDPNDANTAYAARSEFNSQTSTGHVFKTTNGGVTWTDISGNLPDLPTWTIALDDRPNSTRIYAGNDNGVWYSSNGGTTWAPFKTGMPNTQVDSLELNTSLNILLAGTHGRGAFEITATDSISVVPTAPIFVEGNAFSGAVATFTDSPALQALSAYTATINWGDGTVTTGTVVNVGPGVDEVDGSHTYAEEGTYTMVISITSVGGTSGQATSSTVVTDAPLTPSPVVLTEIEGSKFTTTVGSFTDANPNAPLSDFTASIDWGDGVVTPGTISESPSGVFSVTGTHTYQTFTPPGSSDPINITVNDVGGAQTVITSSAVVQDAPLNAYGTPVTIRSVAGGSFNTTIGSFSDSDPNGVVGDYSVSVNWGDGTTPTVLSSSSILSRGTHFDILASHSYTQANPSFGITITVTDIGGSQITLGATAIIADAPITASAKSISTIEGATFSGQVASFVTSNVAALASSFSPTTIDWGDGSAPTPGVITALGNGKFTVSGTHVYTQFTPLATPDVLTVQIVSLGGSTATAVGKAVVVDAPLSIVGVSFPTAGSTLVAGQAITGTVATFTSGYALSPLANFTASIDWGDGTVTAGTITQPGGAGTPFVVSVSNSDGNSHTYASPTTFPIAVTVNDVGGSTATSVAQAVVGDAPFSVTGALLSPLTEGLPFAGSVGTVIVQNSLAKSSDYLASIDWGDGTVSAAQLAITSTPGTFEIIPAVPHIYGTPGPYTLLVSVISLGGNRASVSTDLTVKDSPIIGQLVTPSLAVAGTSFTGQVGSFTQYALTPASDFTATIDWGDGQTSVGTVANGPGGTFTVSGTNLYRAAGNYTPTITVTDSFGSTGVFSGAVTATDPPIASVSTPISSVVGQVFSGALAVFTDPNVYAQSNTFTATINWGDGTAPSAGVITGSSGTFSVAGSHVYGTFGAAFPVTVTILSSGGSSTSSTSTAHVLAPIAGSMLRASDTGVSNTDGITGINDPIFFGTADPTSIVKLYAMPTSDPAALTQVGVGVADVTGHWAVEIGPLGDGSYVIIATMTDPATNAVVEKAVLPASPTSVPLVIATTGPTVSSVSLDARLGQLHVAFQTSPASIDLAGLMNANNYSLGQPAGLGLSRFTPTAITAAPGPNGEVDVTVSYKLGKKRPGAYVVELHAAGLIDLAGNVLNEQHFVTFPQANNYPNPDYVAQINVSTNLAASAPKEYVSKAEQIAAYNFSKASNKNKVVRVPSASTLRIRAAVVPQPSAFRRHR